MPYPTFGHDRDPSFGHFNFLAQIVVNRYKVGTTTQREYIYICIPGGVRYEAELLRHVHCNKS